MSIQSSISVRLIIRYHYDTIITENVKLCFRMHSVSVMNLTSQSEVFVSYLIHFLLYFKNDTATQLYILNDGHNDI